MKYRVIIAAEAEDDLDAIYRWVERADGAQRADDLLARIERSICSLEETPLRGHRSPQLERLGADGEREIGSPPYRIVHEIAGPSVHVLAIVDGRRDLEEVFRLRLLR